MAGKLNEKDPTPFIAVLPEESINMDYTNGEIHWEIEDINDTIIFTYDIHTRFVYWDSVNTEENGRYYRRVHRPIDLEKATKDWYTNKENWESLYHFEINIKKNIHEKIVQRSRADPKVYQTI